MTDTSHTKILLAVSGMSPQIITETLYALVIGKQWIPDEIRLITTVQGKQNAVLQLLEGKQRFIQFLRDYGVKQTIRFDADRIVLIQDTAGKALADLRTPEDNEAAADTICTCIRELTQDENTELHVSLAGGRKTMGFYAGYALSLFGRAQDRLSHVLVSENYESNSEFFYPTPTTQVIYDRLERPLDASEARVWLAEIPFVRLRARLPKTLLSGVHSFSETVDLARRATEETPCLRLHPNQRRYDVNGVQGKLSPALMAILLWIAVRKQQQRNPIEPVIENEDRSDDLRELRHIAAEYNLDLSQKTEAALDKQGLTQEWLEQTISRINSEMKKVLGLDLSEHCKIASRFIGRKRGYVLPEHLQVEINQ